MNQRICIKVECHLKKAFFKTREKVLNNLKRKIFPTKNLDKIPTPEPTPEPAPEPTVFDTPKPKKTN